MKGIEPPFDALPPHDHTIEPGEINRRGCRRCEIEEGARKQLAWMEEMERIEQEVFPDARPRSEVIVEVEEA
jgi:hypothetical protein